MAGPDVAGRLAAILDGWNLTGHIVDQPYNIINLVESMGDRMGLQRRLLPVVTITGSTLVVGCGGGSGGSCGSAGSTCPPASITGPGYYEGTLTAKSNSQSTPAVAIVAETGNGAMSGQNGTYYRFNVGFSGATVTGTYDGISTGAGGTQQTSGSISGQSTSTTLSGTLMVGTSTVDSFQLTAEAVYKQPSALATLMGTWSYTANGFSLTVTIASNGTFTGTDSNNCAYSGVFGIISPLFDAYTETYTRTCNGAALTFTGFATYLPPSGSVGADIKVLADDNATEFLVADLQ